MVQVPAWPASGNLPDSLAIDWMRRSSNTADSASRSFEIKVDANT